MPQVSFSDGKADEKSALSAPIDMELSCIPQIRLFILPLFFFYQR